MLTMPKPVALLMGLTNKPNDCLAPMVMARMAAAVSVVSSTSRWRKRLNEEAEEGGMGF